MIATIETPYGLAQKVKQRARDARLNRNLSQSSLSKTSGVSLGALKKFEHSGKISFESLLKLALTLDCLSDFENLFKERPVQQYASMDELLKADKSRQRGRR